MLNFKLKLIHDENKKIKFEDKEIKFPIVNFFALIFSMSKYFFKKAKD